MWAHRKAQGALPSPPPGNKAAIKPPRPIGQAAADMRLRTCTMDTSQQAAARLTGLQVATEDEVG